MHRLTTGIRSEKCVVRRCRRCASVIECTYRNLDTDMRRLSTRIRSEKCVLRRCRRCASVIECTYRNLDTDMRRLTTVIRSEKCVVRRFSRCANVIKCTDTNLDGTVLYTAHLGYLVQPVTPRLQTCTACYCTEYCSQQ